MRALSIAVTALLASILTLIFVINHEIEPRHEHLIVPNTFAKGIETKFTTYCLTDSVEVWQGEHKETVRSMNYFE